MNYLISDYPTTKGEIQFVQSVLEKLPRDIFNVFIEVNSLFHHLLEYPSSRDIHKDKAYMACLLYQMFSTPLQPPREKRYLATGCEVFQYLIDMGANDRGARIERTFDMKSVCQHHIYIPCNHFTLLQESLLSYSLTLSCKHF